MIYWNDFHPYTILEECSLTRLAQEMDIRLVRDTSLKKGTRDWINYIRIVSKRNNLNVVYTSCLVYYVTTYLCDEGISAGAEEEYFKKSIDEKIFELYLCSVNLRGKSELGQKTYFFNALVSLFRGDEIREYERRVFQHNIRVSCEIREWFREHGKTRDTIVKLLYGEMGKPLLNMNVNRDAYIVFMLSYSEETVWRGLSRYDDGDRLRILLY